MAPWDRSRYPGAETESLVTLVGWSLPTLLFWSCTSAALGLQPGIACLFGLKSLSFSNLSVDCELSFTTADNVRRFRPNKTIWIGVALLRSIDVDDFDAVSNIDHLCGGERTRILFITRPGFFCGLGSVPPQDQKKPLVWPLNCSSIYVLHQSRNS